MKPNPRVLVCGDRNWTDFDMVYHTLTYLEPCHVIEGEAPGADTIGREAADVLKIPVSKFPAKLSQFGKLAGPIRNQQMIDEGNPDLVLAFHDNLKTSKGTKDMVKRARKAQIEVQVYSHHWNGEMFIEILK